MAQSFSSASLGNYVFPFDPVVNTPRKRKATDSTDTHSSSQIKDDGFLSDYYGLVGTELELTWKIMSGVFFDKLHKYYSSGGIITWDPQERSRTSGEKYDVNIIDFDFSHDNRLADNDYVHDVKIIINIRRTV